MSTLFDWLSVLLFSGLAVLYLQRSVAPSGRRDRVLSYLPPALGCAGANWLGNGGYEGWGYALLAATLAYMIIVLKPFRQN